MLKVYKYDVPMADHFILHLPKGARILTVQAQLNWICLWALVDPDLPLVPRRFRFAGTGHPIEESSRNLHYVSTFQMNNGGLVFHIFEIVEEIDELQTKT